MIDVPPESQVYRQVVRKEADAHPIEVDPVVRLYYVEVEEPELASATSDLGRLLAALEREWGLAGLTLDAARLAESPACSTRRSSRGASRSPCTTATAITAIWPGLPRPRVRDRVRRRLDDRRGAPLRPPQRRGARVGGRDEPADPLRRGSDEPRLVRDAQRGLGEGADARRPRLPGEADRGACYATPASSGTTCSRSRSSGTRSCTTCCSGSTRPSSAARRSRSPSTTGLRLRAAELGLPVNPGARAYVLPCIAGHVGADTAGVILSEAPHDADEVNLIVDVGTNAEIVLGNRDRLLAASSPTGPAFEGAQI